MLALRLKWAVTCFLLLFPRKYMYVVRGKIEIVNSIHFNNFRNIFANMRRQVEWLGGEKLSSLSIWWRTICQTIWLDDDILLLAHEIPTFQFSSSLWLFPQTKESHSKSLGEKGWLQMFPEERKKSNLFRRRRGQMGKIFWPKYHGSPRDDLWNLFFYLNYYLLKGHILFTLIFFA